MSRFYKQFTCIVDGMVPFATSLTGALYMGKPDKRWVNREEENADIATLCPRKCVVIYRATNGKTTVAAYDPSKGFAGVLFEHEDYDSCRRELVNALHDYFGTAKPDWTQVAQYDPNNSAPPSSRPRSFRKRSTGRANPAVKAEPKKPMEPAKPTQPSQLPDVILVIGDDMSVRAYARGASIVLVDEYDIAKGKCAHPFGGTIPEGFNMVAGTGLVTA